MPTIELNGAELHYEEAGDGECVVFLHGVWMSSRFFARQLPYFAERYRTVALDFRGHGRSEHVLEGHTVAQYARDVRAFLEALELENAVLVGWSMGSLVAWDYVRQFGVEGLRATVVVDQPASDYTWPDWSFGMLNFDALRHLMESVQTDWDGTRRAFIPLMFREAPSDAEIQWIDAEIGRVPPAVASAILFDQTVQDYRPTFPAVSVPTLVCRGESGFLNGEAAASMVKSMPHARLAVFEGSGHCPFLEEPERFNREIDAFLQGVRGL